jgi:hypothetical protein
MVAPVVIALVRVYTAHFVCGVLVHFAIGAITGYHLQRLGVDHIPCPGPSSDSGLGWPDSIANVTKK